MYLCLSCTFLFVSNLLPPNPNPTTPHAQLALNCSELEALSVKQRAMLSELQTALADCRRQISTMEADRSSSHDLAALYRQEKSRADSLQAFVDLLKQ